MAPGGQAEMGEDCGVAVGSSMAAMIFKVPPLWEHCSMSMFENNPIKLSSRPSPVGQAPREGRASAWLAEGVLALTGTVGKPGTGTSPALRPEHGMISGRQGEHHRAVGERRTELLRAPARAPS